MLVGKDRLLVHLFGVRRVGDSIYHLQSCVQGASIRAQGGGRYFVDKSRKMDTYLFSLGFASLFCSFAHCLVVRSG